MPRRSPLNRLLDFFVFAPLGLMYESRDWLPRLAEKGRSELSSQFQTARVVGQFGVRKGQDEATKAVRRLRSTDAQASAGSGSGGVAPAVSAVVAVDTDVTEHIPVRLEDDPVTYEAVGADELAIPSYDSLAASQVVPRLEGLTPAQLDAVRRYETAHRGRKTVLGKVAQLQAR